MQYITSAVLSSTVTRSTLSHSTLALPLASIHREIDELRSRESAAVRRMELEAQGIRALEHRMKESLHTIETREADLARREKAVEEARLGHYDTAHKEVCMCVCLVYFGDVLIG